MDSTRTLAGLMLLAMFAPAWPAAVITAAPVSPEAISGVPRRAYQQAEGRLDARRDRAALSAGSRFARAYPGLIPTVPIASADSAPAASQASPRASSYHLPVAFEANVGQTDPAVRFLAHAPGGTFFFTPQEVVLTMAAPTPATPLATSSRAGGAAPPQASSLGPPTVLRLQFQGASAAPRIGAGSPLPGKVNYFPSNDRSTWRTNLATYAEITYDGLYPGIDLSYGDSQGSLKGTYTIAAHADPNRLRWRYQGASDVSVDAAGNLKVRIAPPATQASGLARGPITLTEQAPAAWQEIGGRRLPVGARYAVAPDASVSFALGAYDHNAPLTLDPTLTFSTYLGGNGQEDPSDIAVDQAGNVYVAGATYSTNFPTVPANPNQNGQTSLYVSKLNATGSALVYSTYIHGGAANGIAIDASGNAYIAGMAFADYPVTGNALQPVFAGFIDAFLTKLDPSGSQLLYSTFLGGAGHDRAFAVTADGLGNAFVTGFAAAGFPVQNAWQAANSGGDDAFVSKVNTLGSGAGSLVYSTFLGGSGGDHGNGIAVDGSGNAYITGDTTGGFPLLNAYQPAFGGDVDGFVTELNPAGAPVYSTYLGGPNNDHGDGIAVDSSGNAYLIGSSNSSVGIATANAFQSFHACGCGYSDAFVTKFNVSGSTVLYSTYLGGGAPDFGMSITLDPGAKVYITGYTSAPDFPIADAIQSVKAGSEDAFVAKLDLTAAGPASLIYSTFLGGSQHEEGTGIAVDGSGNAYVTGLTYSTDFPSAGGTRFQSTLAGNRDAYIAKIAGPGTAVLGGGPTSSEMLGSSCACTSPSLGKPVNTATGNFWHSFVDLAVPGRGFPLAVGRTYNAAAAGTSGPLGYGWTHSYNLWVDGDATNWYVHQASGSAVPFPKSGDRYSRVQADLTVNGDGSFTFTQKQGQDRLLFNPAGQLTQMVDRNGYATTLSYDGSGRLQSVSDPANRSLTFSYTNALLTGVSDPAGRSVSFGYDPVTNDLTSATDVGGQITHFSYYPGHLLQTMTDPRGGTLTNIYDASNRVVGQTDALSRVTQFGYRTTDSLHTQTTVTSSLGLVTQYQYDDNRLAALVANPDSAQQASWQYTYAANFSTGMATATDPNQHSTNYTYDSAGNLLSSSDPLSRTVRYAYNASNDLLIMTDTIGLPTNYSYDTNGNLLSVSRALTETGQLVTASLGYDSAHPGDVLTITNPLGNSARLAHDSLTGYVLTATNPLGQSSGFTYDAAGRVVSSRDPRGYTSAAAYDAYNAPLRITDTLGFTTSFAYDADHNLAALSDAKNQTTSYTYNLDNEPTRVTRPDGTHSDSGYDAGGQVISQTNALTQTTRYAYDAFGRVITLTDPLTRTTGYSYDAAGNLRGLTDAQSRATTYSYDAADQLLSIAYSDGATPNVAFAYNPLGLRSVMTDGAGSTLYAYDSLGRLSSSRDGAGARVGYGYDLASRLTSISYPAAGTLTRAYDPAGQLVTVSDWLSHTTSFAYNPDGELVSEIFPNGVRGNIGYDAAGQVISLTQALTSTPFLTLNYQRDPLGLLTSDQQPGKGSDSYRYDPLNRLLNDAWSSSTPITRSWGYDGATQVVTSFYQTGVTTPTTGTRSYDAANQLLSILEHRDTTTRNQSFSYSPTGNRTQMLDNIAHTTTSYSYDQANRLTSYNGAWSYSYNGDGQRMSKTGAGSTTQFVWDGGLLLSDGTASYIYGPGGQILEQVQGSTPYYYHTDQLGSVRALTDGAGTVVNSAKFDPYGKPISPTGSTYNPFGYAGEYQDAESGFIYLRARYYDPATQQFLTVDPLLAATEQAYAYAAGSPLNATDPSGLHCGQLNDDDEGGCASDYGLGGEGWIPPWKASSGGKGGSTSGSPAMRGEPDSPRTVEEIDPCPSGVSGNVYRGLARNDEPDKGLSARAPGAGNSPISHVAGKVQSQWISTTKSLEVAVSRFGKHGVVEIDLSKVTSEIIDLSAGIPGMPGMISNWAKAAEEVLIRDFIPPAAIRGRR
jgi:RHS repeat-associated protein